MKPYLNFLLAAGVILLSGIVHSQGVQWHTATNFDEIRAEAKKVSKLIFIDAYTTWCAPCKEMDRNVFFVEKIGRSMQENFITVKLQMDVSGFDRENIKKLYAVSDSIKKAYNINSYPTFIFLNAEGQLIDMESGGRSEESFIALLTRVVINNRSNASPFIKYDYLLAEYNNGVKDYSKVNFIIETAKKKKDKVLVERVSADYYAYFEKALSNIFYQKENIRFIVNKEKFVPGKSPFFVRFKKEQKHIDSVMQETGFSNRVIINTICYDEVAKYLGKHGDKFFEVGITPKGLVIPAWDKITNELRKKFSQKYTDEVVLFAKNRFYFNSALYKEWEKTFFSYYDQYGFGHNYAFIDGDLNIFSWYVFQRSDDPALLEKAINHMSQLIMDKPKHYFMDTYANLLYKQGKVIEGIEWQTIAADVNHRLYPNDKNDLQTKLEKMKAGKKTWTGSFS